MNKKISTILASLLVYGTSVTFSQRPLPYVQEKKEYAADDVVGTWKWFCGSVVTVTDNGEVRAVWEDGKRVDGRFDKIGDNKYRFIWGNKESIDILKIKKEGNLLEGQNQAGSKVTAIKISSILGIEGNQKGTSDHFLPRAKKTMQTTQEYKKFIGEWKMSSWNGHYQLFEDGSCIIDNDSSNPSKGLWFLAFDRLYLVWGMMSDTDVFKLNSDQSMKLQRIDNRSATNVFFEKLEPMNSPSNKVTDHKPNIRRRIRVPLKSGELVKEDERIERVAVFNGHSYKFIQKKMSWKNAKKEAEGMGGYLVCITDQVEDDFVLQLIRDANNGEVPHVWIGLTDDANEGDLKWVNGDKTVYWRNSPNKFLPSDVGEEDFVHYYAAPLGANEVNWNDNIGIQEFSYVIEFDQERPEVVRQVQDDKKISVKSLDGVLYYGYEDDKSFVYAAFLKKDVNDNKFEVIWTLPFYDQKWRGSQPFELIKNDSKSIVMIRGNPAEWLYEAEIDSKGNLVNGKRYVLKNGEKDRQDAVWNLYKVK